MILHPYKFKKLVVYIITTGPLILLSQQVLNVYAIWYNSTCQNLLFCITEESRCFKCPKMFHVLNYCDSVGLRNGETQSYSNATSRTESNISSNAPKTNELGKKGKKPNRVLLSTAGGRRYWFWLPTLTLDYASVNDSQPPPCYSPKPNSLADDFSVELVTFYGSYLCTS